MERVKGTRDWYPEDKAKQNYIFNVWTSVAKSFGYKEVEGPILESEELYKQSGEEIPEQTYQLTDKSGRKLVLRPELTPTIARMIQQKKELKKPIKWFSIPRCFRYESPQSGRLREFYQFNLDCLGFSNMKADAEIIATAIEIMKKFNLSKKDFYIRISNRKIISSFLKNINLSYQQEVSRLIDKKDKLSLNDFKSALKECNVNELQIKQILKFLDISSVDEIKKYVNDEQGSKGVEELSSLFYYLKKYNLSSYCKIDLSIMRGFDYYTSTIFEVFDSSKEFRAIAGGGRYDVAGIPGIGYGMGDVVLELFLAKKKKLKQQEEKSKVYIITLDESSLKASYEIASKLREFTTVEADIMDKNLTKQLTYANEIGSEYSIIIGKDELNKKKFKLKEMKTGKEQLLTEEQIIKKFV